MKLLRFSGFCYQHLWQQTVPACSGLINNSHSNYLLLLLLRLNFAATASYQFDKKKFFFLFCAGQLLRGIIAHYVIIQILPLLMIRPRYLSFEMTSICYNRLTCFNLLLTSRWSRPGGLFVVVSPFATPNLIPQDMYLDDKDK